MYCSACGVQLDEQFQFCHHCGRPTNPDRTSPWGVPKRLTRPLWDKKIGGVCAGFARYFETDVSIMRILWLVIAIFTGVGFIAYLVAWIAMPAEEFLTMPQYSKGSAPPGAPPPPANRESRDGNPQPMQA
ncbi:MAG: PspC domain-containing protein [Bryobacterales bacterium]|nr:PspC domain-containing protein [Bryobacterales bacterium]